jgi:type I restriction enzyme S subunit
MSEWKEYKLSEFVKFGNGKERPKTTGNIPVYGGNGILGYSDISNYDGETIIIGRVGAYCGSVYYQNKPIWVSDNALAAKPKNGNNAKFLYYFLRSLDLNSFAEGSSHPLVTQTLLNSLDISITDDVKTQTAIAEVLSSLDDKIDLLHRQNKTLEQLAETLFRQWFVEDNENVKLLGDLAKVTTGKGLKRNEFVEKGAYPVIGANGEIGRTDKFLTDERLIITGRVGTLGEVKITDDKVWISDNVLIINPSDDKFFYPIYFTLKKFDFENINAGSTQPLVTQTDLKNIEIYFGEIETLNEFLEFCKDQFQKIKSNTQQIRTLTQLRDTLLPKLMSGEVRVAH